MINPLKHFPIYKAPHELEKAWVSSQGDGNNMLILENGEKTNGGWVGNKSSQFPSWLAFILSIEKQEKAEKSRICYKVLYTNSRWTQNQK